MPFASEFIPALASSGSQGLLREALSGRLGYYLTGAEDAQDYIATDPDTGAVTPVILFNGGLFFLDPLDATTAHDGVSVLVSNDGLRYKREDEPTWRSVIAMDETAPPGSPSIGDRYIPAAAATGAWATHDDEIAIFTARGWEFIIPPVGYLVLNEDDDTFYHYAVAGSWVAGLGSTAIADATVLPASLLGGKVTWIVENQTTDAPPGSPTDGDQYIIGSSPSGAWAGHAGKIALARNGAWIIIQPTEGYRAFDKALGNDVVFRASAWQSAAGSYVSRYQNSFDASAAQTIEDAGQRTAGNSAGYTYSNTTAPTASASARAIESYQPTISAKKAGAIFEIEWWGRLSIAVETTTGGSNNTTVTLQALGVFVDTEANARDWVPIDSALSVARVNTSPGITTSSIVSLLTGRFLITLADTAAHTIKFRWFARVVVDGGGAGTQVGQWGALNLLRRRVIIREAA